MISSQPGFVCTLELPVENDYAQAIDSIISTSSKAPTRFELSILKRNTPCGKDWRRTPVAQPSFRLVAGLLFSPSDH